MAVRRPHIPLKTRLAAALCQMLRPNAEGKWERVIDYASAKAMTEDQVLSLWNWDHDPIPKHLDGPDEHWNLVPRPIMEHRIKTATYDVPAKAKADRLTEAHEEFRRKMLAKIGQAEAAPTTKAKRPMPGSKASGWRKRMSGEWERR